MLKESFNAEIRQSRSEKYRGELSLIYLFLVKLSGRAVQKLDLFIESYLCFSPDQPVHLRIIDIHFLHFADRSSFSCIRKKLHFPFLAVINAFKRLSGSDRPVHRTSRDTQLFLNIIQKVKGILCISVHLINKRKDRDVAHSTDLKQLPCLRLHSL